MRAGLGMGLGLSGRYSGAQAPVEPMELQLNPDSDMSGIDWTITNGAWAFADGVATAQGPAGQAHRTATAPGVEGETVHYHIEMPSNPDGATVRFTIYGTQLLQTTTSGNFDGDIVLGPVADDQLRVFDMAGDGGAVVSVLSVTGLAPPFEVP